MKIEFKAGDTITIPDGCKATVKDGEVVIEQEFKDGDVLHSIHDGLMLIYKENCSSEHFNSHFNTLHNHNNGWTVHSFRYATEKEKQLLFNKMKEQCLKWNAEEKRVEKLLWRADAGEEYYHLGTQGIPMEDKEGSLIADANRYKFGNYFRTKEQAEEAAKRIKEVLYNYHEEIKE